MKRLAAALALLALPAVVASPTSGAGLGRAAAPFVCPKDATETDTQKWVKNFDGARGSIWCDDGATAVVTVNFGPSPVVFKGGVCTSSSQGTFVSIGTIVTYKREASDPPFFQALKWTSKGAPQAGAFARKGEFIWRDEMTIKWNKLTGSWSGTDTQRIGDTDTVKDIKATAKFNCKRIVKTSF